MVENLFDVICSVIMLEGARHHAAIGRGDQVCPDFTGIGKSKACLICRFTLIPRKPPSLSGSRRCGAHVSHAEIQKHVSIWRHASTSDEECFGGMGICCLSHLRFLPVALDPRLRDDAIAIQPSGGR